jgi:hypothetical protein
MTTVVFQSHRPGGLPSWIARCTGSVRAWAARSGHAYELLDDALFAPVPAWYRERVAFEPVRMSDLGRLLHARRLLAQHERVIWVDADVMIFDPDRFTLDAPEGFAFCREAWLSLTADGRVLCSPRVNNAVSVFARGNPFLDFYVHACEAIVRRGTGPVGKLDVGTHFLTHLHQAMPLPLLGSVALLSPPVLRDLAAGEGLMLRLFRDRFGGEARAINLCASLRGQDVAGVRVDDALFEAVIDRLVATQGEALNGALARGEPEAR